MGVRCPRVGALRLSPMTSRTRSMKRNKDYWPSHPMAKSKTMQGMRRQDGKECGVLALGLLGEQTDGDRGTADMLCS